MNLFIKLLAALELARYGIGVVAVALRASLSIHPLFNGYNDSWLIDIIKAKVIGNKLTQPEQIADTVYLTSLEVANVINDRVVMVDEGYASFK
ncbi:hypothetical protein COL30_22070 [Bacillus pseudomycoides]|nr:hypothetical protein COO19_20905 [Bacillus pseudomycoides]PED72463.1 hypothetical protein CON97_08635 [Bacillus pseudomycoides]PEI41868.1 hypothetical protein CN620_11365 [Bacillus pseudomycoides]PEI93327.1 hypothetical protein CN686_18520 [Bacillus pseudomycoides]PEJ81978.1 hypothetical protein CN680_00255 [Bacillus pseudomycoides]